MDSDSSLSSDSLLTYYSASDTSFSSIEMQENADSISSSSSLQSPSDQSLNSSDSNIGNLADILIETMKKAQTCLYDIRVEITLQVPKEEAFNKPDVLRATVYTITSDITFKYKEWKSLGPLIALKLGRAMKPNNCTWMDHNENLIFHERYHIHGHYLPIIDVQQPPIVFDTLEFNNYICASTVELHYIAQVFVTPAVIGAERFYELHGFDTDIYNDDSIQRYIADILEAHREKKLDNYNHHLAWATVYNVLEGFRQSMTQQHKFIVEYGVIF